MRDSSDNDLGFSENSKISLGIMFRGACMGLAELVPGISGGTIAFVTGIYAQLVGTLARFGPASIVQLGQPKLFWQQHNLGFLLSLGFGMCLGIILLAPGVRFLLANAAPLLWAFFFGLIWASVIFIGRARRRQTLRSYGSLGLLLGFGFLLLPMGQFESSWLSLFIGGAIAVCAWILPAVSGSFVLLLLGLYDDVIVAISDLDLMSLSAVALGCLTGLALFVRALHWLLKNYEDRLLSALTGFMAVALAKLWPWQDADAKVFFEGLLWPDQYAALTGQSDYVIWVGPTAVLGFLALWLLQRVTRQA